ncbi:hypothetical protein KQI63_14725 [bacterium]|nr:hypothetical protein [bacterium]
MMRSKRYPVAGLVLLVSLFALLAGCGSQNDPDLPTAATPTQPYMILSSTTTRGIANDIDLSGDKLYVAENGHGITRYNISNLGSPFLEYQYSTTQRVEYIRLAPWNNLLVAGMDDRFQIFLLGDTLTYTTFIEYLESEDFVMIPDSSQQFSIVDFETKDIVGTRVLRADRLEGVVGTYIYPDSTSNPPDEYRVGTDLFERVRANLYGTGALGIATIDSFYTLAVGLKDVGVGILQMGEIIGADQTSWLSDVDTPGEATRLVHQNGYLYVADGPAGLTVIDVTSSANPVVTSNWTYPGLGHANQVAVQGNHLVLVDRFDGAFFFDLATPAEPEFVGLYDVREPTDALFVESGELILSSVTEGLTVLQLLY